MFVHIVLNSFYQQCMDTINKWKTIHTYYSYIGFKCAYYSFLLIKLDGLIIVIINYRSVIIMPMKDTQSFLGI